MFGKVWVKVMPSYHYKAFSYRGNLITGEAVAASTEDLRRQLSDNGLLVHKASRRGVGGLGWLTRDKVKTESFLLFNQELIALIRAGIPIPEALALVADRPDQPFLQRTVRRVLEDVNHGSSFSQACSAHPQVFDPLYLSALKVGEKSGRLASVLARYQDYLKTRHSLKQKLSKAMAYPIFLLLTLLAVVSVLFAFVLPRFIEMYANFNARLPAPTRLLISLVENFYITVPFLVLAVVLAGTSYRYWVVTEKGRLAIDKLKLDLPYFGGFARAHSAAQMTRMFSTLLASGMPLVETMTTISDGLTNRAFAQQLAAARNSVADGESLAAALDAEKLLPKTALKVIQAGETAGNLAEMLGDVALHHEQLLENRIERLLSLFEPALMLLLGIFVGGIIVVMYLPIFSIADVVQ